MPKKEYFINIPPILVRSIIKQLKLSNPVSLENIETIVHWCVAGSLAGDIFNDTMLTEETSKRALKKLERQTEEYIKDLEGNEK